MAEKRPEIVECDEAGNTTATYVQSPAAHAGHCRIDVILPKESKSPWVRLLDVFLPAGYPHSVTDDYLEYQIYDSLQAFSSSIAGLLSSRAVLSSVGVGDATASPTAALLLSILQESAGRIATILFAHRFGTSLEPECKMYRLLADVLNDIAFIHDCMSPAFPKPIRVIVLSFSSVLRALCGVAAGSAKASLSAHFARWGNLGELNAKDSSQETVISLFGMLAGSMVVSWITTPTATWTTLILLLAIHLETNRRAVSSVSMRTLNRQRATIVYHHLKRGHVPTPEEVSKQERIFERSGVLRNADDQAIGHCTIGACLSAFLAVSSTSHRSTGSFKIPDDFAANLQHYKHEECLVTASSVSSGALRFLVVLKKDSKPPDVVVAWWTALMVAEQAAKTGFVDTKSELNAEIRTSRAAAQAMLAEHLTEMEKIGWDLETGAMETRSSPRVTIAR